MHSNVPNLDAFNDTLDLIPFHKWMHSPAEHAGDIFPGMHGRNFDAAVMATRLLGAYATHKEFAIAARKNGNIEYAQYHEGMCDKAYASLPYWARW